MRVKKKKKQQPKKNILKIKLTNLQRNGKKAKAKVQKRKVAKQKYEKALKPILKSIEDKSAERMSPQICSRSIEIEVVEDHPLSHIKEPSTAPSNENRLVEIDLFDGPRKSGKHRITKSCFCCDKIDRKSCGDEIRMKKPKIPTKRRSLQPFRKDLPPLNISNFKMMKMCS
jgi:hypothetical protein